MKIFIDTANLDEIRKSNEWGIIDGVTTHPLTDAGLERFLKDWEKIPKK